MRTKLLPLFVIVGCTAGGALDPMLPQARGAELYARHCAACHGTSGDADTVAAALLHPRPSPFRDGRFKLVSTANGMPTEDDLVAMLRRGMPGSTMMAYGHLPDADLVALARHVRELAVQSRAAAIERDAAQAGQVMTIRAALDEAQRQLQPGEAIVVGPPGRDDDATLAQGEQLYQRHCASCHGADGRGQPGAPDAAGTDTAPRPRDFTAGYLRGGSGHAELALRVRAGMPAAQMPPTQLDDAQTAALVAFVRSLIPPDSVDHHVQWRRTLRVPRSAALPQDGDTAAFARVDRVRLPLAPLRWRDAAIDEVWLTAAHDGNDLLLRLEWADATADARPRPGATLGDGAAVQFALDDDAPLLAMGTAAHPVNTWRWRAFDAKSTAGLVDLLEAHRGLDVPISGLAPSAEQESVRFGGVTTARDVAGSGLPMQVHAAWLDGHWSVTFRRPLRGRDGEVDLRPGKPVLFALAVWDGSTDPHPGSKSITSWHELQLLP
ncbi:MAG: c-type cytochrome [Planctomycetota bacterium]